MPQPTFALNAYGWDVRQYVNYGGLAVPVGLNLAATLPYIDLNDAISWFGQEDFEIDGSHDMTYAPQVFRNRDIFIGEDHRGRHILVPFVYEASVKPLGAAVAPMVVAGKQLLTFDGATAYMCRLHEWENATKMERGGVRTAGAIAWKGQLDFFAEDPFPRDIALTATSPVALANGANIFTFPYIGTWLAEPQWQINIPSGNLQTLSQVTLTNSTSGEQAIIQFTMPGTGPHTIIIDTSAWKATLDGVEIDNIGNAFPSLFPAPQAAAGNNTIGCTLTAGGAITGWTFQVNYYNRWVR